MEEEQKKPRVVYVRPRMANWVGLFVSLTIIIFAFFILLNSYSTFDEQRKRKALSSLRLEFSGVFAKAGRLFGMMEGSGSSINVQTESTDTPGKEAFFKIINAQYESFSDLEDYVDESGSGSRIGFVVTPRGMVVTLGVELTFAEGSAELTPTGEAFLNRLVGILEGYRNDILVEGHTDNEGNDEINWILSQARAMSVLLYLNRPEGRRGIALDRLSAAGVGQYRPIAENDTEEGRAANRRVDIIIKHPHIRNGVKEG
jgi:chemotaxis protein MotB